MNKILIVDDDREFSEELKEMLSGVGYDPVAVNDSTRALEIARRFKPDLIMLDMKMDGLDGFKLKDLFRRCAETEEVPVVGMTGYGAFTPMDMVGMEAWIKKPFHPTELIAQIENFIGQS